MRKILLVAVFSLFALGTGYEVNKAHLSPKRDEASQFIAAILRGDGTLVPFAQYGNGGWSNPWPNSHRSAESIYAEDTEVIRHSLGGLPEPWFRQCGKIPETWYFWSLVAAPAVLSVSRVMQVENHSQTNWALLTSFPTQSAEDSHHRNIGVALNVNEKIEPMIEIKTENVEGADLLSFIKQLFDEAETAELNKIRAEQLPEIEASTPFFSLSSEARAKVRMSITKLYRTKSSLNGKHLYYFEAEKQYEKPATSTDPSCNDVSLFQGWMEATERGGLGLMDSRLFLTNCDKKGPSSATPLGIMTLKNEIFLFVSEHGWEDESYMILELSNSGLHKVLETFGG
jgi:hypothetical protein